MNHPTANPGADLSDLARVSDDHIDLGLAALRVAMIEYAQLDTARWMAELDRFAARALTLAPGASDSSLLYGLDAALFIEAGFHGNAASYYDPRNSFLNDVLERRMGIPITLSVVYIEVGRRVGLRVEGVGFPGHFLVGYFGGRNVELIDPYNRGARVDEHACRELLERATGSSAPLRPEMFNPASNRQILVRMLNNLKLIYTQKGDLGRAVSVMDRILQIAPDETGQFRDRGLALFQLGDWKGALRDLEMHVRLAPSGTDLETVHQVIAAARRSLARLN